MGRELRRVPLDFDWPIDKTWKGFLNDRENLSTKCPHCDGRGDSPEYKLLHDQWYGHTPFRPEDRGSELLTAETPVVRAFAERNAASAPTYYGSNKADIAREARRLAARWNTQWCHHLNADDVAALVAAGRLWNFMREWIPGKGWQDKPDAQTPTPRQVNDWSMSGMGHDAINCWTVLKAECKRLGHPTTCKWCGGAGEFWPSEEAKAHYEAWERTDPPTGEGYQIWQTVGEGSPISPVFATPLALAEHMATTRWGADEGTSVETWLAFIEGPGWAPSMVSSADGVLFGVEAVVP